MRRARKQKDGEMKERDRSRQEKCMRKGRDGRMNVTRCEKEGWKECMGTSLCPSLLTVSILYWADHLL